MWSFKRKRLLGFIQLLVCAIIYSRGWLRAWIQCTLHSRALYCQASSSWITIAPNLIINILTLSRTKKPISQSSPTKNEDRLRNKGLYCTFNGGLRTFKLPECCMWFFTTWIENENKIFYSEKNKKKKKIKKQTRNEPPARKSFRFARLSPNVELFLMACFPILQPTRWVFWSFSDDSHCIWTDSPFVVALTSV